MSECREKDPDVIFIGDCVLETLQHTQTWNQYFAPLHSLNFSIYMDETQNTLWRVQNGVLDNVKPKVGSAIAEICRLQHFLILLLTDNCFTRWNKQSAEHCRRNCRRHFGNCKIDPGKITRSLYRTAGKFTVRFKF